MAQTWEILGHRTEVEQLATAARKGAPYHGYLFTGAQHIGKRTTAERFAQALLCEQGTACGNCGHCLLVSAGNHPDLISLPNEGNLSIKQVRELKDTLILKPHSAVWRVAIIPNAERLGIPAQNALLKLLEEPPAHTVLILTAVAPEALLATTVSRLQQLRFRKPAADELVKELGGDTAQTAEAVAAAGGRPGLAKRLLADEDLREARQQWGEWLLAAQTGTTADRLVIAKQAAESERPELVLEHWLAICQQALLAVTGAEEAVGETAQQLAAQTSPVEVQRFCQRLLVARNRLGYNPNAVVLFEQTLVGLS